MQHKEVDEEAFVAPDTQGDADSPFVDPSSFSPFQAKTKKRAQTRSKHRIQEPTLVCHTEPADVVQVEGALFIINARCGDDRWATTWLIDNDTAPLNIDSYKTGQDYKSSMIALPGHLALDRVLMLRPLAWR